MKRSKIFKITGVLAGLVSLFWGIDSFVRSRVLGKLRGLSQNVAERKHTLTEQMEILGENYPFILEGRRTRHNQEYQASVRLKTAPYPIHYFAGTEVLAFSNRQFLGKIALTLEEGKLLCGRGDFLAPPTHIAVGDVMLQGKKFSSS